MVKNKKISLIAILIIGAGASYSGTVNYPLSEVIPSSILEAQTNNQPTNSTTLVRKAFAYEAITLDATAGGIGFTAATYAPTVTDQPSAFSRAEMAVVNCNNAQARYRVDGGTVTTSNGMLIQDGDWFLIYGYAHIAAFKGIRTGATSVVCDVTFYRNR